MDREREAAIRYRAYERWREAGQPRSAHFTNWLIAEKEYEIAHAANAVTTVPDSAPHLVTATTLASTPHSLVSAEGAPIDVSAPAAASLLQAR